MSPVAASAAFVLLAVSAVSKWQLLGSVAHYVEGMATHLVETTAWARTHVPTPACPPAGHSTLLHVVRSHTGACCCAEAGQWQDVWLVCWADSTASTAQACRGWPPPTAVLLTPIPALSAGCVAGNCRGWPQSHNPWHPSHSTLPFLQTAPPALSAACGATARSRGWPTGVRPPAAAAPSPRPRSPPPPALTLHLQVGRYSFGDIPM